jgi:hypothetical protein
MTRRLATTELLLAIAWPSLAQEKRHTAPRAPRRR